MTEKNLYSYKGQTNKQIADRMLTSAKTWDKLTDEAEKAGDAELANRRRTHAENCRKYAENCLKDPTYIPEPE